MPWMERPIARAGSWVAAGLAVLLVGVSPSGVQAQIKYCGEQITVGNAAWKYEGPCVGTLPLKNDWDDMTAIERRDWFANSRLWSTTVQTPRARRCGHPNCSGSSPLVYLEVQSVTMVQAHWIRPRALPRRGVVVTKFVTTRVVGGIAGAVLADTLTGAGQLESGAQREEQYLVITPIPGAAFEARATIHRFAQNAGGRWRSAGRVDAGTYGACEAIHGPWAVAASDFVTCSHAHRALMHLNPARVDSAATIYRALRDSTPPDSRIRNGAGAARPAENAIFKHASLARTRSVLERLEGMSMQGTPWPPEPSMQLDFGGWSTCALGCCAVYRRQ